jgi:hypothetical protein
MIVSLQTRFTPLSRVYDTDAPASDSSSGIGKIIKSILKPYARVQEGNITLYEMNKPYPDESTKWKLLIGLGIAAGIVGGASLIFGLGRISKK